jgi:signal transduction histidine kinase
MSGYIIVNDINSNPKFILQVNGQRTAYQQGVWVENLFIACSICIAITFGAATLTILERRIIKPMNKLATAVQDLPFEPQAMENRHAGNHEIVILSNAVRSTLNKRMDAMLEVSRMVAHDLRNPLSGIRNANYVLKKNYSCYLDSKGNLMLTTIDDCVDYSDKIVKDLLDYSTQLKLSKVLTPLPTLITKSLQTTVVPQNITVITETKEQLAIYLDPEKLQRVFSNLIKNAIDAMSNQGTLTIKSKRVGENVVIEFSDNGVGMSEETLKKLWQPFFTTKAKGMGVGLAICKKIIEAHEGTLEAKSALNKGTTFKVSLPLRLN